MLRVGLTGELGSGKSTVAAMLAKRGAVVLSSDEMGRKLMQPGQDVYAAIVQQFGGGVVQADGALDRRELARLAFSEHRVDELNAIVHPAVLAAQAHQLAALAVTNPEAIAVIESALIFTTIHGLGGKSWSGRFDRIILVTAPESVKVARFVERAAAGRALTEDERATLETDARQRLAAQHISSAQAAECVVIRNDGRREDLEPRVDELWRELAVS